MLMLFYPLFPQNDGLNIHKVMTFEPYFAVYLITENNRE